MRRVGHLRWDLLVRALVGDRPWDPRWWRTWDSKRRLYGCQVVPGLSAFTWHAMSLYSWNRMPGPQSPSQWSPEGGDLCPTTGKGDCLACLPLGSHTIPGLAWGISDPNRGDPKGRGGGTQITSQAVGTNSALNSGSTAWHVIAHRPNLLHGGATRWPGRKTLGNEFPPSSGGPTIDSYRNREGD